MKRDSICTLDDVMAEVKEANLHVREVFKSQGYRIVILPPNSRQFNPIELLFLNWKNIIKSGMTIFDGNTLLTTISAASTQISGNDCAGLIREATRFASQALQISSIYYLPNMFFPWEYY
ncbi:hypothetical protein RF11_08480 [Thelohanellus kitauei]|uniref:Tc1-like transposase DDE domain-containing protein n=1 Tax=Thelohanellus kitauei TaxID=669202 RepID=A0A0C2NJD0_THEKT|nr:hypothetical protein RF11_08480 [Thelohanellus kitauei]